MKLTGIFFTCCFLVFIFQSGFAFNIPQNYDKTLSPAEPVEIKVSFEIYQLQEVDDLRQDITLDVGVQLFWTDERFKEGKDPNCYKCFIYTCPESD